MPIVHDGYPGLAVDKDDAPHPNSGSGFSHTNPAQAPEAGQVTGNDGHEDTTFLEYEFMLNYESMPDVVFDRYSEYCREKGLDGTTPETVIEAEQATALLINAFNFDAAYADVELHRPTVYEQAKMYDSTYRLVNPLQVAGRIEHHYKTFPTDRTLKSPEEQRAEKDYVLQGKRPVYLPVVYAGMHDDASGKQEQIFLERSLFYPQIGLALALRDAFQDRQLWRSAKAADTVIAAHGHWFLQAIRQSRIVVVGDEDRIVRVIGQDRGTPATQRPDGEEVDAPRYPLPRIASSAHTAEGGPQSKPQIPRPRPSSEPIIPKPRPRPSK